MLHAPSSIGYTTPYRTLMIDDKQVKRSLGQPGKIDGGHDPAEASTDDGNACGFGFWHE